jgi:hypothetical protein
MGKWLPGMPLPPWRGDNAAMYDWVFYQLANYYRKQVIDPDSKLEDLFNDADNKTTSDYIWDIDPENNLLELLDNIDDRRREDLLALLFMREFHLEDLFFAIAFYEIGLGRFFTGGRAYRDGDDDYGLGASVGVATSVQSLSATFVTVTLLRSAGLTANCLIASSSAVRSSLATTVPRWRIFLPMRSTDQRAITFPKLSAFSSCHASLVFFPLAASQVVCHRRHCNVQGKTPAGIERGRG